MFTSSFTSFPFLCSLVNVLLFLHNRSPYLFGCSAFFGVFPLLPLTDLPLPPHQLVLFWAEPSRSSAQVEVRALFDQHERCAWLRIYRDKALWRSDRERYAAARNLGVLTREIWVGSSVAALPYRLTPQQPGLAPLDLDLPAILVAAPEMPALQACLSEEEPLIVTHFLVEMAQLLVSFHRDGYAHGDLDLEAMAFDSESESPLLPDLSSSVKTNPEDDVQAFALVVQDLIGAHLTRSESKRMASGSLSDMEAVLALLKTVRGRLAPAAPVKWLRGPAPMVLGFVLFAVAMVGLYYIGFKPASDSSQVFLAREDLAPREKIRLLREKSAAAVHESERRQFWSQIAAYQQEAGLVVQATQVELTTPVAVWSHPESPAVVYSDFTLRLGDSLETEFGMALVTGIALNQIRLLVDEQPRYLTFNPPDFPCSAGFGRTGFLVWDRVGNGRDLLRGLAELNGLQFVDQSEVVGDSLADGNIAGLFLDRDPASFLAEVSSLFRLEQDDRSLRLLTVSEPMPVYLVLPWIDLEPITLGRLSEQLSTVMGCEVLVRPEIRDKRLEVKALNATWQELLKSMNVEWDVVDGEHQKAILLRDVRS